MRSAKPVQPRELPDGMPGFSQCSVSGRQRSTGSARLSSDNKGSAGNCSTAPYDSSTPPPTPFCVLTPVAPFFTRSSRGSTNVWSTLGRHEVTVAATTSSQSVLVRPAIIPQRPNVQISAAAAHDRIRRRRLQILLGSNNVPRCPTTQECRSECKRQIAPSQGDRCDLRRPAQ